VSNAGEGVLSLVIWPAYVGACTENPAAIGGLVAYGEPETSDYQRGMIQWAQEGDDIVGRAFIRLTKGEFTHLAYFHGPEGPAMGGAMKLPHPIVFDGPGVLEVYPITNPDLRLNQMQGKDY